MQKPTILHIYKDFYPPVQGGIEKCIHWMCDETRRDFHVRVLVASRSRQTIDEVIDGVRVIRAGSLGRFLSAPVTLGFSGWLRRLDSDILHFHMPNPTGEISYLLARPDGRVVVTYHSDIVRQKITGLIYGPLQQKFLSHASIIMPTSQRYLDSSKTLESHRERCRVVPLGSPLNELEETPSSHAFTKKLRALWPDRTRIAFLGVLRYYKGLSYLIRAMKGIEDKACLLIGGEGPERAALERLVAEMRLDGAVEFLGEISDDQGVGLRHAADLFVLPAHLRAEAFGLSQIEAMACGLPVVSCDLPTGVPEINRDGETGLIVPPADSDALREALRRLIENPDLRRQMGEAGRVRAQTYYTSKKMGENLRQVYNDVLSLKTLVPDKPGGRRERWKMRYGGAKGEDKK